MLRRFFIPKNNTLKFRSRYFPKPLSTYLESVTCKLGRFFGVFTVKKLVVRRAPNELDHKNWTTTRGKRLLEHIRSTVQTDN